MTYLPHVNSDIIPRILSRWPRQDAHSHDIIKPIVPLITRLKLPPQQCPPILLRWATCLNVNICAIVCPEIIPRVREEDSLRVCHTPVCAEILDCAGEFGTFECAACDWNYYAGAEAHVSYGPASSEGGVHGVEEVEGWRAEFLGECGEE